MNDDILTKVATCTATFALFAFPAACSYLLYRATFGAVKRESGSESIESKSVSDTVHPKVEQCESETTVLPTVSELGEGPALEVDPLNLDMLLQTVWERGDLGIKGLCVLLFTYVRLKDYFGYINVFRLQRYLRFKERTELFSAEREVVPAQRVGVDRGVQTDADTPSLDVQTDADTPSLDVQPDAGTRSLDVLPETSTPGELQGDLIVLQSKTTPSISPVALSERSVRESDTPGVEEPSRDVLEPDLSKQEDKPRTLFDDYLKEPVGKTVEDTGKALTATGEADTSTCEASDSSDKSVSLGSYHSSFNHVCRASPCRLTTKWLIKLDIDIEVVRTGMSLFDSSKRDTRSTDLEGFNEDRATASSLSEIGVVPQPRIRRNTIAMAEDPIRWPSWRRTTMP